MGAALIEAVSAGSIRPGSERQAADAFSTEPVPWTGRIVSPGVSEDAIAEVLRATFGSCRASECDEGEPPPSRPRLGNRVLTDVADQCGGLPSDSAERLFDALSISRQAVEAHGRLVVVKSKPA